MTSECASVVIPTPDLPQGLRLTVQGKSKPHSVPSWISNVELSKWTAGTQFIVSEISSG